MKLIIRIVTLTFAILLGSCASYGPYHPNTSADPRNSVRGPKDGRYKLAFIEFGDQGSALDLSQCIHMVSPGDRRRVHWMRLAGLRAKRADRESSPWQAMRRTD